MAAAPAAPVAAANLEGAGEEPELFPPNNFSLVTSGIYRGGFPTKKNLPFLRKLGLQAVLALVPEAIPDWLLAFYDANGITLLQHGLPGNKEPFVDIPQDKIASALQLLLDCRNYPVFIHCNKGKHRTGCLVGCLRKLQAWSVVAICDEYRRFAAPKSRVLDQQFIELFDIARVTYDTRHKPKWL